MYQVHAAGDSPNMLVTKTKLEKRHLCTDPPPPPVLTKRFLCSFVLSILPSYYCTLVRASCLIRQYSIRTRSEERSVGEAGLGSGMVGWGADRYNKKAEDYE